VGRAIDTALAARCPVVIDVLTDPNVPTLPPHITFEQAKNYSTALLHMDPDEGGIIKESVKSLVEGIIPGVGEKR
jgi:pyruvate dehydrogenase (quinone)